MFDRALVEEIEAVMLAELLEFTGRKIFLEQVLGEQPDYEDTERARKIKQEIAKQKRKLAPQYNCRPELQELFEAACRRMILVKLLEQPDTEPEPDNVIPFAPQNRRQSNA